MPVRSTAYISVLPHPGPPPTCPLPLLPTKVKAVKRAHPTPVPMKKVSPPGPKLPEGYAFVPLLAPERGAQAETRGLPNDYQYYQQSPPCEAPGTQGRFGRRVVLLPKRGDDLSDGVMKVKPRVQGPFCWRRATDDGPSGCGWIRRAMELDDDVSDGHEGSMVARFGSHFGTPQPNSLSTCDTDDGESGKFNGRPLLPTGDTDDVLYLSDGPMAIGRSQGVITTDILGGFLGSGGSFARFEYELWGIFWFRLGSEADWTVLIHVGRRMLSILLCRIGFGDITRELRRFGFWGILHGIKATFVGPHLGTLATGRRFFLCGFWLLPLFGFWELLLA
ncbi:hypothetical protein B0H17DRAFT_1129245 [Mycena rosella]|uniref:Uncharacterized protein n=1 Tax=Mycena rosella TaxID=1033263 RepID=A0AAD7DUH6_MYCRO|nr:hypothetical protein B0H17DRAFT_1129245 [Mycena rosella]